MSDASVSAVSLPGIRSHWRGQGFARVQCWFESFQGCSIGSLTIHEG